MVLNTFQVHQAYTSKLAHKTLFVEAEEDLFVIVRRVDDARFCLNMSFNAGLVR